MISQMKLAWRPRRAFYQVYLRIKGGLNYLFDRVVEQANLFLMDYYYIPFPFLSSLAKGLARRLGNLALLLRDFPRLPVFRLASPDGTVILVGSDQSAREAGSLLFDIQAEPHALPRTSLWNISHQVRAWLDGGADLVICETSPLGPFLAQTPINFTIPPWVQQEIKLPADLGKLVAGKRQRGLINRAEKNGFSWAFTRSQADFDCFYHEMYLPFIHQRHTSLALVTPYADLLRWFLRGGLVLVIEDGRPVAGMVAYLAGRTCYLIEEGVLHTEMNLWQQGVNAYLYWAVIQWGRQSGADRIDIGGSRALASDGSFTNKRRWEAYALPRKRVTSVWRFQASRLPETLRQKLNARKPLVEVKGQVYSLYFPDDDLESDNQDLDTKTQEAQKNGLHGLVAVFPDKTVIKEW